MADFISLTLQRFRRDFPNEERADEVITSIVLKRLEEIGYVDDERFAHSLVAARQGLKPKGKRAIRLELAQKGVSEDIVNEALGHATNSTELDSARVAIRKKIPQWKELPDVKRKTRIFSYLQRRGFDASIIRTIIDEVSEIVYNDE